MPTRKGHARWEGSLQTGKGKLDFGGGAFQGSYSAASRFEEGQGTNPEELIAAAHASCFAMALSGDLVRAGLTPEWIDATAHVTVRPEGGGHRITKSHLVCEAKVPGVDQAAFVKLADKARANCPVSRALGGTEITLEARLAGS